MGASHGALIFPCLALRLVAGGCVLPLTREGFQPAAVTVGPQDKLIMANAAGMLLFADLDDFTIQEDLHFSQISKGSNIQGLTMTSPESTYLYLGAQEKSQLLEYEWHSSHQRGTAPGFAELDLRSNAELARGILLCQHWDLRNSQEGDKATLKRFFFA